MRSLPTATPLLLALLRRPRTREEYDQFLVARHGSGVWLSAHWDAVLFKAAATPSTALPAAVLFAAVLLLTGHITAWGIFRGAMLFLPWANTVVHRALFTHALRRLPPSRLVHLVHFWACGYNMRHPYDTAYDVSPQWVMLMTCMGVYAVLGCFVVPDDALGMTAGFHLAWAVSNHAGGAAVM